MPSAPPPVFDSLVLAAVAEEIRRTLLDCRITDVVQPDPASAALRLRTPRGPAGLVCSIHPRWARCLLTALPAGRPDHPFVRQLRARLAQGRLQEASVEPFERVLVLRCATLEGELALTLEVMGRHSNLLLVEGDRIAGAFKIVTPAMSRVRPVLPGRPYVRPPRDRPTPADVEITALAAWLDEGRPVAQTLVRRLLGVSPPVAAHLALRAGLDPERAAPAGAAAPLAAALRELAAVAALRTFAPVWYADEDARPVAYAAVPLLPYGALTEHRTATMSRAAAMVLDRLTQEEAVVAQRQALLARIHGITGRNERAAAEVAAQLDEAARGERWRRFGEVLLAYARTVPPGADQVTLPDFDGTPLSIPLDPRRSPVVNAQVYFRRQTKAAAARRALPARQAALQQERAYLEQLRFLAGQAPGTEELQALAAEVAEVSPSRAPRRVRAPAPPAPRIFRTPRGLRILVGRTGRENDHVTFKVAGPEDLWLHARGMPGAHVILKTAGAVVTDEDVETAAAVAAHFSQGRGAAAVPVDVTARRHVRKPKGGRPGIVTYREHRTLLVAPRLPGAATETAAGAPAARTKREA